MLCGKGSNQLENGAEFLGQATYYKFLEPDIFIQRKGAKIVTLEGELLQFNTHSDCGLIFNSTVVLFIIP